MSETLHFITESNAIEGIQRPPTDAEIAEYERFMNLRIINILDLEKFVSVYQPNERLRDKVGTDVMIGYHRPPRGGPRIFSDLRALLTSLEYRTPYENHQAYEELHPFTDGNGRSGRMLWMWQMKKAPLGFLHTWYYQSLDHERQT